MPVFNHRSILIEPMYDQKLSHYDNVPLLILNHQLQRCGYYYYFNPKLALIGKTYDRKYLINDYLVYLNFVFLFTEIMSINIIIIVIACTYILSHLHRSYGICWEIPFLFPSLLYKQGSISTWLGVLPQMIWNKHTTDTTITQLLQLPLFVSTSDKLKFHKSLFNLSYTPR